jgi:2-keto-4-pentenoate hydratase/2-oxohepta-3-ene-1,7-dioic acid hydratase in catechol pathway
MARAIRYADPPSGAVRIGRLEDDGTIVEAGPDGSRGFVPDAAGWALVARAAGPRSHVDSVRVLPPVVPTKIVAIGLNYRSHVEETSLKHPEVPVVFAKWPSCLAGHRSPIVIPPEETRTDWEGELAVVFARTFTRASLEDARGTIGGYCAFNDVSGRRAQLETPMRQFTLGKSFDTFGPMGPCLVSAEGVDLHALDLETTVNGETVQRGSTGQLIFGIEQLVEYVSRGVTIEAGDVLISGTPGGVGDERTPPWYLQPGDVVTVEVSGCPVLANPVAAG